MRKLDWQSLHELKRQFTTETWKNHLTQGVIALFERFNPEKDCMLILECGGNASGCIAVTHMENNVAQLRYFFLKPELRGLDAGTKLLNAALEFCRQKNTHMFFMNSKRTGISKNIIQNIRIRDN